MPLSSSSIEWKPFRFEAAPWSQPTKHVAQSKLQAKPTTNIVCMFPICYYLRDFVSIIFSSNRRHRRLSKLANKTYEMKWRTVSQATISTNDKTDDDYDDACAKTDIQTEEQREQQNYILFKEYHYCNWNEVGVKRECELSCMGGQQQHKLRTDCTTREERNDDDDDNNSKISAIQEEHEATTTTNKKKNI